MGRHRIGIRAIKLGLLVAGVGFIGEGSFEIPRLLAVLSAPSSVPGESKIVEHFALQHAAFPSLCFLLVLRPALLRRFSESRLSRWFVAVLAVVLIAPEVLVSFGGPGGGDLFRPYPFDLRSSLLAAVQMVEVGAWTINLLQLQHLLLNHLLLSVVLAFVALRPRTLDAFFGPHTGAAVTT